MQVTSLELSKRLKEREYEGEHDYRWIFVFSKDWELFYKRDVNETAWESGIPAYQFHEIWAALPVEAGKYHKILEPHRIAYYGDDRVGTLKGIIVDKSPTEAAGKMLEWCIDNGYVK
jgi:hypothetical protein